MSLFQFMKQYKAKDILQNKRLLVSNPKYFNDPFDSRVAVDDNDPEYLKISREWASCPIEIGVGFCCKNPYEKEFNYYTKLINILSLFPFTFKMIVAVST